VTVDFTGRERRWRREQHDGPMKRTPSTSAGDRWRQAGTVAATTPDTSRRQAASCIAASHAADRARDLAAITSAVDVLDYDGPRQPATPG
jgi:hypothetical protein